MRGTSARPRRASARMHLRTWVMCRWEIDGLQEGGDLRRDRVVGWQAAAAETDGRDHEPGAAEATALHEFGCGAMILFRPTVRSTASVGVSLIDPHPFSSLGGPIDLDCAFGANTCRLRHGAASEECPPGSARSHLIHDFDI